MKKIIKVDYLSRVEGEGGITVEIKDGKIKKLHMDVFEAPRFFEAFIKGRHYSDVVDFVARICGICPIAYQMSAVYAIERIFGIEVNKTISNLRRLLYCGEWISSHALHIYLLQGPDFYGLQSAWASKDYIEILKKGLNFKKIGNQIISLIGGRSIHPVSVRVGGFFKTPRKKDLISMKDTLQKAFEESLSAIRWASQLEFNDNVWDMEYISLGHHDEYPMNHGSVVSSNGMNVSMDKFLNNLKEYQVEYSTALHSGILRNGSASPYMVGPISRVNLNYKLLPSEIKAKVKEAGISFPIKNIQMGIIARSIELSYAINEAIRLIAEYEEPEKPFIDFTPIAGEAVWITEAPRGMLIHKYVIDNSGYIKDCTIIPPTSQNLAHIERDLHTFIQKNIDKPADYLKKESEKIIRSYDPCISCSVHFVIA